jgi:hypothetical protein
MSLSSHLALFLFGYTNYIQVNVHFFTHKNELPSGFRPAVKRVERDACFLCCKVFELEKCSGGQGISKT